jgi:hypothetical protein
MRSLWLGCLTQETAVGSTANTQGGGVGINEHGGRACLGHVDSGVVAHAAVQTVESESWALVGSLQYIRSLVTTSLLRASAWPLP